MDNPITKMMEEREKIKYYPGDIIYADSNYSENYDCFGVVVDKEFWKKQVKRERILEESLTDFKEDFDIPFRVLGTKLFRQYWRCNDPNEVEPNEHKIMHYLFNTPFYTEKVNLRLLIQARNDLLKSNFNRGMLRILNSKNDYLEEALGDAKIVYDYLDGKRFDKSKMEREEYISSPEKFLRLLEKAIPIKE